MVYPRSNNCIHAPRRAAEFAHPLRKRGPGRDREAPAGQTSPKRGGGAHRERAGHPMTVESRFPNPDIPKGMAHGKGHRRHHRAHARTARRHPRNAHLDCTDIDSCRFDMARSRGPVRTAANRAIELAGCRSTHRRRKGGERRVHLGDPPVCTRADWPARPTIMSATTPATRSDSIPVGMWSQTGPNLSAICIRVPVKQSP